MIIDPLSRFSRNPFTTRLQRLLLKLLRYNLIVKYEPEKELHIPDTLSRTPRTDTAGESELEAEMTLAFHIVVSSLSIFPSKLNDFCQGTLTDAVISYIQSGWPHLKKDVSQEVQSFGFIELFHHKKSAPVPYISYIQLIREWTK